MRLIDRFKTKGISVDSEVLDKVINEFCDCVRCFNCPFYKKCREERRTNEKCKSYIFRQLTGEKKYEIDQ